MCARCAREVAEGGFGPLDNGRRGGARRRRVSTRATPFAVVMARARMQYVLVAHQVAGSAEPARTIASTTIMLAEVHYSTRWSVTHGGLTVFVEMASLRQFPRGVDNPVTKELPGVDYRRHMQTVLGITNTGDQVALNRDFSGD